MKNLLLFFSAIFISFGLFAQLPETFDLRDSSFVTSVKSQQGGTCWTHGTMAAIESNLLVTGAWANNGETGEPNLAEYHLDWWNGFNQHNNDDLSVQGSGLEVHMGGDYLVSTAYLSRLEGAVRDIDGQSFDNPPTRYSDDFHFYYPRDVEWFTIGDDLSGIDSVKSRLMQQGAIATCMAYDNSFIDSSYNHYQPTLSSMLPNHSVTIVGWDDNHIVPAAPANGAWIVKNSWGADWGNSGYFWISYYDKWSCKEPEMGAVSFINVEPLQFSKVYFYDYHGWRDTKNDITEAYNAFNARENTWLTSVSFFTASDDVDYRVKVYGNNVGDSLSFALSIKEGNIAKKGFHTIDLELPVKLHDGDDFYIYLYLSEGGQPYDRTSLIPVLLGDTIKKSTKELTLVESAASEGESFYFEDNMWKDLYDYDDPSGYDNTGNFCIKGLAKDVQPEAYGAVFHIIKSYNRQGIQNANVTFNGELQTSDKQGDVQFLGFAENTSDIALSIRADGYRDFDSTINILDTAVVMDIRLISLTSVDEVEAFAKIYPNPANDFITIQTITNTNFDYQIFDVAGRVVQSGKSNNSINISTLKSGFYFINLNNKTVNQQLKFIKK